MFCNSYQYYLCLYNVVNLRTADAALWMNISSFGVNLIWQTHRWFNVTDDLSFIFIQTVCMYRNALKSIAACHLFSYSFFLLRLSRFVLLYLIFLGCRSGLCIDWTSIIKHYLCTDHVCLFVRCRGLTSVLFNEMHVSWYCFQS